MNFLYALICILYVVIIVLINSLIALNNKYKSYKSLPFNIKARFILLLSGTSLAFLSMILIIIFIIFIY